MVVRQPESQWAAIGLGANLGDRAAYLLRALGALIAVGLTISQLSQIYETDPVDYLDQPPFLNMVAVVSGPDLPPPPDLLAICLKIETDLGRDRLVPKGPRCIDLDLLLDLICEDRSGDLDLILPHPRMHQRRFVLAPLVELMPERCHPISQLPYKALLTQLSTPGKAAPYRD
jgi:2-amino-4-hydroxy-6-hydroxymethyldihydropteridine diphosphokinase